MEYRHHPDAEIHKKEIENRKNSKCDIKNSIVEDCTK